MRHICSIGRITAVCFPGRASRAQPRSGAYAAGSIGAKGTPVLGSWSPVPSGDRGAAWVSGERQQGNRAMTTQKSLKHRVRDRMSRTGERYTAARRQVLAKSSTDTGQTPLPPVAEAAPEQATAGASIPAPLRGGHQSSDEAVAARTGHTWPEWYALLDEWGAADRPHGEIAAWLNSEHGVTSWWSQEVTVGYEVAIGRRRPGERAGGFSVTASKTIAVSVERLFAAFVDEDLRARWLPGVSLRLRVSTPPRSARFDWEDGSSRVAIGFTAKGETRSAVAVGHERLPDAEAADAMKALWRVRLAELQHLLED